MPRTEIDPDDVVFSLLDPKIKTGCANYLRTCICGMVLFWDRFLFK